MPLVVFCQVDHSTHACGDAPLAEATQLVAAHLRHRGAKGRVGPDYLTTLVALRLGRGQACDKQRDKK